VAICLNRKVYRSSSTCFVIMATSFPVEPVIKPTLRRSGSTNLADPTHALVPLLGLFGLFTITLDGTSEAEVAGVAFLGVV